MKFNLPHFNQNFPEENIAVITEAYRGLNPLNQLNQFPNRDCLLQKIEG